MLMGYFFSRTFDNYKHSILVIDILFNKAKHALKARRTTYEF